MKKIFFIFLFVFLTFSFLPESSHAYLATEQTAVKLNEDTLLFTITYRFSYMNYALRMPIGAVRADEFGKTFPYVGYALYTEDGSVFREGKSSAIVLSDADIVGTEYVTELNKAEEFTLVSIVKLPESVPAGTSLYMRATTQPFTLVREKEIIPSQLTEQQLTTYHTPPITL